MLVIFRCGFPIEKVVNSQTFSLEDAVKSCTKLDSGAAVKFILNPNCAI